MADIFLSYTEKDRDAVRRLAEMLQSVGWSVWWDRRIPAGLTWRSVLDRELQSMRCMVVLWSLHSVQSEWVCEEAAEGRRLGRLVPVAIDRVRPPAGFREIQAADLVDWDGSRDFVGLQRLVEDIERLIGKPGVQTQEASILRSRPETDDTTAIKAQNDAVLPHIGTDAQPVSRLSLSTIRRLVPLGGALVVVAAVAYFGALHREPVDAPNKFGQTPVTLITPTTMAAPSVSTAPPGVAAGAIAPSESPMPAVTAVPKPVAPAVVTSSQTGKGTKRAIVKTVPMTSSVNARCTALSERLELGEALSSESQLFLRRECQK